MFGIDSPELLVIAVVALVVIGPKELPGLLRSWGKWMAKMRGMASEFRGHVDEMVRQSELDEVKKQIVETTSGLDLQSLDPTREIKSALNEGMAEGEKALADAQDNLAKPPEEIGTESAPPVLESPEAALAEAAPTAEVAPIAEAAPAVEAAEPVVAAAETAPALEPESVPPPASLEPVPEPAPGPAPPKSAAAG